MIIRKAKVGDVSQIIKNDFDALLNRGGPLDKLHPKRNNEKTNRKFLLSGIYGKDHWLYVAEDKGKILGFISFKILKREDFWDINTVGHVDLVYVFKEQRRKGLARLLLVKAEEIFRKERIKYIHLSVMSAHKEARKVWDNLGFKDYMIKMYKRIEV